MATSEHGAPSTPPFVSVLVLIKGDNPNALVEALLSLASQTESDFEVLLVSADDRALTTAHELAAELPPSFGRRVRRVAADSSGVATLATAGLAAAEGAYVVVMTETDTLFADWVAHVKRVGTQAPGSIVRGTVLTQRVQTVHVRGRAGVRATSSPKRLPGPGIGLTEHLETGRIPVLGVAFPMELASPPGLGLDLSKGDAALPLFLWAATCAREVVEIEHVVGFERVDTDYIDTAVVADALTTWVDSGSFRLPAGSSRALLAERANFHKVEKVIRQLKKAMQLKDDHIDNIEAMLNAERQRVASLQEALEKRDARIATMRHKLARHSERARAADVKRSPAQGETNEAVVPGVRGRLGSFRRRSPE